MRKISLRLPDIQKSTVKIAIILVATATIAGAIFFQGIQRMNSTRAMYIQAKKTMEQNMVDAASPALLRSQLDAIQRRWDEVKIGYATSVDGGAFFDLVGRLARENDVKDIRLTNAGEDNAFYRGHLHARYYTMKIKGPFPAVYRVLNGIETSGVPTEIKPVTIKAAGDAVDVEATVVLYSLNPPEWQNRVSDSSGVYDPFFDPDMIGAEEARQQQEQQEEQKQEQKVEQEVKEQLTNRVSPPAAQPPAKGVGVSPPDGHEQSLGSTGSE